MSAALTPSPLVPICRSCHRPMDRRPHETLVEYRRRQTCSLTDCTGQGAIQPDFPAAVKAETVPPRCPRCGGPWRAVATGVCCVLCGRDVMVTEALVALATRT